MRTKAENNDKPHNHVELTSNQIFKKIKEELSPIQENLSERKITIDEAKSELKKINEWIQWTKLENKDKTEISKAFDKLICLEKNIDENTLNDEVNEIVNLLETLTQRELGNLKSNIQTQKYRNRSPERPIDVQKWINQSSNELIATIHEASQDKNLIARKIGERMEYLMS